MYITSCQCTTITMMKRDTEPPGMDPTLSEESSPGLSKNHRLAFAVAVSHDFLGSTAVVMIFQTRWRIKRPKKMSYWTFSVSKRPDLRSTDPLAVTSFAFGGRVQHHNAHESNTPCAGTAARVSRLREEISARGMDAETLRQAWWLQACPMH